MKVVCKCLAQGGDERQRSAAEQYGGSDVASMGERDHGLHGHGMKDRGGNVLLGHVLGYQVLYVRLAEYAAAGSDGINPAGVLRQLIHVFHIHAKDNRHLVYECACPSGTVPIHAEVFRFRIFKEYHFGVLSANVYHGAYLRIIRLHRLGGCHNFLDKRDACQFGKAHAHRARHFHAGLDIAQR